jgi:hypothetical protein
MTLLAATSSQTLWYLNRGAGVVSLVLLTVSLALGIAEVQRWTGPSRQHFVVTQLHRNASLVAVVFLVLHIVTGIADGFAGIRWLDAVVPFVSYYRPFWLGLGALAFDLVVALVITSLLRGRIGYPAWRVVHWTSYACWPLAFVHGLGTGSDGRVGWLQVLDLVCLGAVVAAIVARLVRGREREPGRRLAGAMAVMVFVVGVGVWAYNGPAKAGWARKAGTPAALLGSSSVGDEDVGAGASSGAPDVTTAPKATSGSFTLPFQADFTGTITRTGTQVGGPASVVIEGSLSGGASGALRVEIDGVLDRSGGVQGQRSAVTMGPSVQPNRYGGTVTSLENTQLVATVVGPDGARTTLFLQFAIEADKREVTGTVTANAATRGQREGN